MKNFVKDYLTLCKDGCRFYRDHWKGMIVLYAVSAGVTYAYLARDEIMDKLKETFKKN